MKKLQTIGLSLFALASLAACSEQGSVAGVSAPDMTPRMALGAIVSQPICSTADPLNTGSGPWFITPQNPAWSAPIPGSSWVGRTATSSFDYPRKSLETYASSFNVPAGSVNISIQGFVLADNAVVVFLDGPPRIHASGNFGVADASAYNFPAGEPDFNTSGNFQTAGGIAFGAPVPTTGNHTVTFLVYNDDNLNYGQGSLDPADGDLNPSGLSFCYTVRYDEPPPPANQGCSPGYWKNHNFPAGYIKTQAFNSDIPGTNFENAFPGKSFQTVLSDGGGGLTALGRITVSAYFNAVALGANYGLTPQEVVTMFNNVYPGTNAQYNALKDQLEAMQDVNGRTCPNPTGK